MKRMTTHEAFSDSLVLLGVEICRWNRNNPCFLCKEPARTPIFGSVLDQIRNFEIIRYIQAGDIDQNKISSIWDGAR